MVSETWARMRQQRDRTRVAVAHARRNDEISWRHGCFARLQPVVKRPVDL